MLKILIIGISFLVLNSCDKEDSPLKPESTSLNKILALGASRVEGCTPNYESFRHELWKDLIENSWTFDYIGTQSDRASYPLFKNRHFDVDHEGRGGWTSGQILNDIKYWLAETGAPGIVLFSSPGGNDTLQNLPYDQTLSNINGIVDALQNANPEVTILIEQLAPARSDLMTTELINYFNKFKRDVLAIAAENATTSSKVIAVDMFTGFTDCFLADDVHYSEAGADFVASRYYEVLENILK
jgi:lysophospholipase L1-like esterase